MPMPPAARFCPQCGLYLNPMQDRVLRASDAASRWKAVRFVIVFYSLYLAVVIPLAWVPDDRKGVGMLVGDCFSALLVLGAWGFSSFSLKGAWRGLGNADRTLLLGLGLLVPMLALNQGYHWLVQRVLDIRIETYSGIFLDHGLGWGWMVLSICVMPGLLEEIAFRGLIWSALERAVQHPRQVLMLSSVLFCIIHGTVYSAPYLLGVGLGLGALRLRSGSLLPGMLLHALHNLGVLLMEHVPALGG